MNKSDLVGLISEKKNISLRAADHFVNIIIDSMIAAFIKEERIEIRGFGSFVIRKYESYEGRNPKTGKKIIIPEKRLPFFKAGKDLVDRINEK